MQPSSSHSKSSKPSLPNEQASGVEGTSIRIGQFVLEGNSILCQCPSCKGPMSVRMWLLEAECWQCGTLIEISESTRAAIELAMKQRAASTAAVPSTPRVDKAHAPTSTPPPVVPVPLPTPKPIVAAPTIPVRVPPVQRRPKPNLISAAKAESGIRSYLDWLDQVPAWLISLLAHLILFILLAIWTQELQPDRTIVLSLSVNREHTDEDQATDVLEDAMRFDGPLGKQQLGDEESFSIDPADEKSIASDLSRPEYAKGFRPSPLAEVRSQLNQPYQSTHGLLARDIRLRSEILKLEGGTLMTEAAVARGLQWLAKHQRADGSWKLDSFAYDPGRGTLDSDPAATALALLPFLGAGQTPKAGIYRNNVHAGLRYLLSIQNENGSLQGGTTGEAGMYVHGQATIVLCEALAMTRDQKLLEPARRAIGYIIDAQHRRGGWRYRPKMLGDTSVLGWQIMALQSAKMAGIEVPNVTFERASKFLDSVSRDGGATYGYLPGQPPSANMTAEAILCRFYLGASPTDPKIREGLRILSRKSPPNVDEIDYYYWYYATQAFHHVGGEAWKEWNDSLRQILVGLQVTEGKHAGSWEVDGYLADPGGRLYVTALAICTLEVYYRHLPLFERLQEQP